MVFKTGVVRVNPSVGARPVVELGMSKVSAMTDRCPKCGSEFPWILNDPCRKYGQRDGWHDSQAVGKAGDSDVAGVVGSPVRSQAVPAAAKEDLRRPECGSNPPQDRQPSEPPAMSEVESNAHEAVAKWSIALITFSDNREAAMKDLHAAITALARERFEAGKIDGLEWVMDNLAADNDWTAPGPICEAVEEERDRLRALKEVEHGG